jgi:3-isopropylmalate/(R)-2-methylmalate dehydratase large subunit
MKMTLTQKILASHAGLDAVRPGDLIQARVDLVLANDITAPLAIREFERIATDRVFDRKKIALVCDHFTPNKDIKSAELCKMVREFARSQRIENFFEGGEGGIEHALLPEKGLVLPGDLVIGADSHTCTYGALAAFATGMGSTDIAAGMATGNCWFRVPAALRFILEGRPGAFVVGKDVILHIIGLIGVDGAAYRSMEFCGPGLGHLSMTDRFTMANMAIEAGAKNGIFPFDEKTALYVDGRAKRKMSVFEADEDAHYERTTVVDLAGLRPVVALPHLPGNVRFVDEIRDVRIDQAVIGSCTNGRLEDMRQAASLLKGNRVAKGVRLIVIPATPDVYRRSLEEGLIAVFLDAGAVVGPPTCGPCLGGHMGVLAKGERAVSTTNRNFVGRMGHPESEVYLSNPAVAAASAITGKITDPSVVAGRSETRLRRSRKRGGSAKEKSR